MQLFVPTDSDAALQTWIPVDAPYNRILETPPEKLAKVAEHLENARTDLTA